jgi:hypothetical protein
MASHRVAWAETARSLEKGLLAMPFATTSLLSSRTYPRINRTNWANGIRQMDTIKEKKVVGREAKGVNEAPQEAVPIGMVQANVGHKVTPLTFT